MVDAAWTHMAKSPVRGVTSESCWHMHQPDSRSHSIHRWWPSLVCKIKANMVSSTMISILILHWWQLTCWRSHHKDHTKAWLQIWGHHVPMALYNARARNDMANEGLMGEHAMWPCHASIVLRVSWVFAARKYHIFWPAWENSKLCKEVKITCSN